MVPIKYKGFTAEVTPQDNGYTGTFQLDGSTCVFIASTVDQIKSKFEEAVEEGLVYLRRNSLYDELLDFIRKHNKDILNVLVIEYKPYHGLDYFAYLPRKEVLFVQGDLSTGVPFLTLKEVSTLLDEFPLQSKRAYLGEYKLFRAIPWESVIEVMSEQ